MSVAFKHIGMALLAAAGLCLVVGIGSAAALLFEKLVGFPGMLIGPGLVYAALGWAMLVARARWFA